MTRRSINNAMSLDYTSVLCHTRMHTQDMYIFIYVYVDVCVNDICASV